MDKFLRPLNRELASRIPVSLVLACGAFLLTIVAEEVFSRVVGGGALGGKAEAGRLFVRGADGYVEVSGFVFVFSAILSAFEAIAGFILAYLFIGFVKQLGFIKWPSYVYSVIRWFMAVSMGSVAVRALACIYRACVQ